MTTITSPAGDATSADQLLPPGAHRPFVLGDPSAEVENALNFLAWCFNRYKPRRRGHIAGIVVRDHDIHLIFATRCPPERVRWIGPLFVGLVNMFAHAYVDGTPFYRLFAYGTRHQATLADGHVTVLADVVCEHLQSPVPFTEFVLGQTAT